MAAPQQHQRDTTPRAIDRISTGISGCDHVLGGELPRGHTCLVEGESGAGKTTVGLQFLIEGNRRQERTLWIDLSEAAAQLRQIGPNGITIGEPVTQFQGVLSGRPEFTGTAGQLARES